MADALYGEAGFIGDASQLFGDAQIVSQLRENQNIEYRGKKWTLKDYFNTVNKGAGVTLSSKGR